MSQRTRCVTDWNEVREATESTLVEKRSQYCRACKQNREHRIKHHLQKGTWSLQTRDVGVLQSCREVDGCFSSTRGSLIGLQHCVPQGSQTVPKFPFLQMSATKDSCAHNARTSATENAVDNSRAKVSLLVDPCVYSRSRRLHINSCPGLFFPV